MVRRGMYLPRDLPSSKLILTLKRSAQPGFQVFTGAVSVLYDVLVAMVEDLLDKSIVAILSNLIRGQLFWTWASLI